jgi:hypothetical protein
VVTGPGPAGVELDVVTAGLPADHQLRFALYPRALLRTTGLDVRPLQRLLAAGPDPLAALTALREAFADPRLEEAVAQSNPAFHEIAFAPGRALTSTAPPQELTKHGRRQVRTAHRYLRRLLGRTETNAFFGPTLVVGWDPDVDEPVTLDDPVPERCVIGLSYWVVLELADRRWREQPAAARRWRRDPLWSLQGEAVRRGLDGRALALTGPAATVWQALASPASASELTARTGLPPRDVVAGLAGLAPALTLHPRPPSTVIDGLGWLRATHPAGPGPRSHPAGHPTDQCVDRLAGLVARAERAAWPDTRLLRAGIRAEVDAAGLTTSRSAGRHYADRDVVNEDRSSPWSGRVRLGRPAIRSAHAALRGLLPMMLLDGLLRQADARQAVVAATAGTPVPLAELAARTIAPVQDRTAPWQACLAALVPGDGTGDDVARVPAVDTVRIGADDLAAAVTEFWALTDVRADDQRAAFPGLDLMLTGGGPGVGRWVLSECHDDSSSAIGGITSRVQGSGCDFEHFCAVVARWLDTGRMATVLGRRRSRHVTPELPGLTVELSGRSAKPAAQVVPAAEVLVAADGAAIEHAGRRYQLYPGDVASPLFRALSLPCLVPVPFAVDRGYTPRIVVGEVVVQRRRWTVDLPGRSEGAAAVRDHLAGRGLPGRFFLRHPDEPKPLLIDLRDGFCLAELARLRPDRVVATESLPDLDDTWWEAGGRQPAELRMPVFLRWDRQ